MDKKALFTTIVIQRANELSHGAQAALRRNLEKYSEKIRVIMVCESTGNLIPAIKSRCLLIRIMAPTNQEVLKVLIKIAENENCLDNNMI